MQRLRDRIRAFDNWLLDVEPETLATLLALLVAASVALVVFVVVRVAG